MLRSALVMLLGLLISSLSGPVMAAVLCPFCDAPTLVMAEQIQMCDHLLLGRYLGGVKSTEVTAGSSRFEVLEIAFSKGAKFQKGQVLEIPQYVAAAEGATMPPSRRKSATRAPPGSVGSAACPCPTRVPYCMASSRRRCWRRACGWWRP